MRTCKTVERLLEHRENKNMQKRPPKVGGFSSKPPILFLFENQIEIITENIQEFTTVLHVNSPCKIW